MERYVRFARWLVHRGCTLEEAAARAASAFVLYEVVQDPEEGEWTWVHNAFAHHTEEILQLLLEDLGGPEGLEA